MLHILTFNSIKEGSKFQEVGNTDNNLPQKYSTYSKKYLNPKVIISDARPVLRS